MKQLYYLSVLLLALSIVLAVSVHFRLWQSIDWATLEVLQSDLPRSIDMPFSLLSLLGLAEITGLIFLAVVWRAQPSQRLPLIIAFGAMTLLELIGKTIVYQPETPDELVRYVFHIPIPSGSIQTLFSFPSGHVARTTFLIVVLVVLIASGQLARSTKMILGILLFVLEIAMLISRVYLAEHWLTDVIGGALLGGAFAIYALVWQIKPPHPLMRRFF